MKADEGSLVHQAFSVCWQQAQDAYSRGEVPVGACLLYEDKIIVRACNQVVATMKATAHAELLCIEEASTILQTERLVNVDLYSTLEPCMMCTGALLQARIRSVNFLEYDERQTAFTRIMGQASLNHRPSFSRFQITSIPYRGLLQKFFQEKRR